MKKLLLLFMLLGLVNHSYAQEDGFETISLGADFFRRENLPKPVVREVIGGTVIQVQYEGDEWEKNLDRKNAFEYACRILEEQLKTAIPIKVKVKFGKLRGQNVIAKTIAYTDSCQLFMDIPRMMLTTRSAMKWIFGDRGTFYSNDNITIDFFDFPDGQITFSNEDIFSYSMDCVEDDKYDFVTVALRELCKVMGFFFNVPADNENKVLDIAQDKLLLYDRYALAEKYNPVEAYNYATSGNVKIYLMDNHSLSIYNLYSPSVFENGRSLSYFAIDEANNETKLMQADLPRGTSIRYVGKWLRPFLVKMGWRTDIAIGPGGGGSLNVNSTSTDKVKKYNEVCSFSGPQNRLCYNTNGAKPLNEELLSDIDRYINQFSSYPREENGHILYGWVVSVLRKDGTWDIIPSTTSWENNEVSFMPSSIDPANADHYARSSDGYLRCRVNHTSFSPGGYTIARYFLLDYLPQKPEMAFSKVMPQTRSAGDEYYADVKIAFKNVEGTESILVEQLEEGSPVPFTYYVENVKDGYFIASVDKEYKTTFKLRAMNKNGETISEELIVPPLVQAKSIFDYRINDD